MSNYFLIKYIFYTIDSFNIKNNIYLLNFLLKMKFLDIYDFSYNK